MAAPRLHPSCPPGSTFLTSLVSLHPRLGILIILVRHRSLLLPPSAHRTQYSLSSLLFTPLLHPCVPVFQPL
ncbi:hypothetical protein HYQ46_001821 [Verticillium longisporum]|nr:hypothetical protein HYQ46_001821 [Verticillium longisporum]